MAITSKNYNLTHSWQELGDNSGSKSNAQANFYVNTNGGIFYFGTDKPDDSDDTGMYISAGSRITYIPQGTKLYGKLKRNNNVCTVVVNIDS